MTAMQYQHALQADDPFDDDVLTELDGSHEPGSLDVPDIHIIMPDWDTTERDPVMAAKQDLYVLTALLIT